MIMLRLFQREIWNQWIKWKVAVIFAIVVIAMYCRSGGKKTKQKSLERLG
jgi:hypothetical protein